ncbi:E3 ubiquitin-protein ligase sina-like isoform X2 [Battus philenor]|uniref:E3 ubiquitin-protein ligase sina-like isoform X2 n=1 Tax=Battus philenor TaxID=42288 RepID=UPI0035CFF096
MGNQESTTKEMQRTLEKQQQLYEKRFQEIQRNVVIRSERAAPVANNASGHHNSIYPNLGQHSTEPGTSSGFTVGTCNSIPAQSVNTINRNQNIAPTAQNLHTKSNITTSATPSAPPAPSSQFNMIRERAAPVANKASGHHNSIHPNLGQHSTEPGTSSGFTVGTCNSIPAQSVNTINRNQNIAPTAQNLHTKSNITTSATPSAPPAPSSQFKMIRSTTSKNKIGGNEINCPSCGNKFGSIIFQCSIGHSSCQDCKDASVKCRISNCGKLITDIRNRTLEAYIAELSCSTETNEKTSRVFKAKVNIHGIQKIYCPNKIDGCKLYLNTKTMAIHLKECPFNEMSCPLASVFGQCFWRGKINQLSSHFMDSHPEHCQADVNTEMTLLNIKCDNRAIYLVLVGNYNFLVNLKVDAAAGMIYMAVQLIGTNLSADKWHYELHIYNKNTPKRKYLYSDACTSNTVKIEDIFKNQKCAVIPCEYVASFVNQGSLNYKFYIKKQVHGNNIKPTPQKTTLSSIDS